MRKTLCFLPMILLLLLSGCAGQEQEQIPEEIQNAYRRMESCQLQGQVCCRWEELLREYSFLCSWTPQESTAEVLAPAELSGIRARMTGEQLLLEYRGLSLDAGALSPQELSPVQALPLLLRALRQGYVTAWCRETLEQRECIRLSLDESGAQGEKIYYDLWLDEEFRLLAGEIRVQEQVLFTCRIQAFTWKQGEEPPPA